MMRRRNWNRFIKVLFATVYPIVLLFPIIAKLISIIIPETSIISILPLLIPIPLVCVIALVLTPFALILLRTPFRITLASPVCFFALFALSGFEINRHPQTTLSDGIGVVTWNTGQNKGHSIHPFIHHTQPDIIATQGNGDIGVENLGKYGALHTDGFHNLNIYSKYQILESAELSFETEPQNRLLYGAKHRIQLPDNHTITLFNVHLPSLREAWPEFKYGFIRSIFSLDFKQAINAYHECEKIYLRHLQASNELIKELDKVKSPYLIVGDFNCTPNTYLHRKLNQQTTDAFDSAGKGFGYTFPGETKWKIGGLSSLVRIDFIRTSKHLKPSISFTERKSQAQHKAVFCMFLVNPQQITSP